MAGKQVLVVDDEPFILRSLSFVLQKGQHQVLEARDGEQALALIKEHHPRLVFLDVMMPKMNGYDVVRAVREDESLVDVHLVLLTAKGQESDRTLGIEAGANAYMTKPFSPSKILEVANEVLAEG
ncbi:MAG: two-component system response regulator [Planctomycetota bacterium]|nr:MAG: two-component system response regulator [Planctomycetota bacterium]